MRFFDKSFIVLSVLLNVSHSIELLEKRDNLAVVELVLYQWQGYPFNTAIIDGFVSIQFKT